MGTGVMIGVGIFALTGQIAELAGPLFPLPFVVGAIATAFSAYIYIKMSNAYPSVGCIAMILENAYGPTTTECARRRQSQRPVRVSASTERQGPRSRLRRMTAPFRYNASLGAAFSALRRAARLT